MTQLDKQGDQLCGTVADDDIFKLGTGIGGDGFTQGRVFSVGIGGDGIEMLCKRGLHFIADTKGIDIGGKADDILFFNMIDGFDLFKIAAVKMVFVL